MSTRTRSILLSISALVILALPFVLKPYVVTGVSMEPAFMAGDYLLVEKFSPLIFGPARGAPVVFRDPRHPEHPIIVKRVVGRPNETIRIKDDSVTVIHPEGREEVFETGSRIGRNHNGGDMETKLGPEDYFLMGDNRSQSEDSRVWGTIQPHEMIGRPVFRIWPLSRIGIFPG